MQGMIIEEVGNDFSWSAPKAALLQDQEGDVWLVNYSKEVAICVGSDDDGNVGVVFDSLAALIHAYGPLTEFTGIVQLEN